MPKYELSTTAEVPDYDALRGYVGRSAAVTVASSGGGLFYHDETDLSSSDNGGSIIVDYKGRRWKNIASNSRLSFNAADVGISPSRTAAFNRSTLQDLIDHVYERGSGEIWLPDMIPINATIYGRQRVMLVGPATGFVNQYVSGEAEPLGGGLFMASGSNADVLVFRCDLTNDAGVLREASGRRNSEARHFGGARNITIWGNRSESPGYTEKDLNAIGHGVVIEGSRAVTLENVVSMYCADDGYRSGNYNYGTGVIPSNNLRVTRFTARSNGGSGMNMGDGDSTYLAPDTGYNGLDGITTSVGNTRVLGGESWNNGRNGVYATGNSRASSASIVGHESYDNDECGYKLDGSGANSRVPAIMSCMGRGNGRDTGATGSSRANFHVSGGTNYFHLAGNNANGYDQDSVQTAVYGFYIGNTTYSGVFTGNFSHEAITADLFVADTTKLIQPQQNENFQLFSGWQTLTTVTSNTIAATASTISMNCSGTQTINDITYSGSGLPVVIIRNTSADAVTLTHNSAKLRLANATNVVLAQNEAVMLVYVSGTVWQQIGAAA